jgi:hypothetical protein
MSAYAEQRLAMPVGLKVRVMIIAVLAVVVALLLIGLTRATSAPDAAVQGATAGQEAGAYAPLVPAVQGPGAVPRHPHGLAGQDGGSDFLSGRVISERLLP